MEFDKNMSVLIVDDHKSMLRIIRNILQQIGLTNIDEALDGTEALQKLANKKYGLILSDWNMMPMTGLQLIQYIRTDSTYQHKHVPFVMVTAEARPENVMEAKQAGIDNYITKPFDAPTLESKIKAAILRRNQM